MPRVRKTKAAEAVATHLGWDIDELVDMVYQPTLLFNPTVFTDGEDYYCATKTARKPKTTDRDGYDREFVWQPVFKWNEYTVWCSKMNAGEA